MQLHFPRGSQSIGKELEKIGQASEILLSFFRVMGIETPKSWVSHNWEFDQKSHIIADE